MSGKHLFIFISILGLVVGMATAAGPAPETGKFFLFLQGQHFGSETYSITKDANGQVTTTSQSEMLMQDGEFQNRLTFESRLVLSGATLGPKYYEYHFKGGRNDGYEVTFDGNQITRRLIMNGVVSTKTAASEQPEVLILDYNIYHHYQLLLDRYDQKKKGKQVFSNYVPLIGDDVEVSITLNGEVPLGINQKTVPTVNYTVDFPMNYGAEVWATQAGRVVKIRMKQNGIEAIRAEFVIMAKK